MAEAQKTLGSAKRYGTRYGRTIKYKVAKIEAEQRRKHDCPYCGKTTVSRVSFGIWNCSKCKSTFAARAYTVGKKVSLQERTQQLIAEAPVMKNDETPEEG